MRVLIKFIIAIVVKLMNLMIRTLVMIVYISIVE